MFVRDLADERQPRLYLLPAPRVRGNPNRARTDAVIYLPIPCAGAVDVSYADLGMADKTPALSPVAKPLPLDKPRTPTGKTSHNEPYVPTPLPLVNNAPRLFALGLERSMGKYSIRIGGTFAWLWMLRMSGSLQDVPGFVSFDSLSDRVYVEPIGGSITDGANRVRQFIQAWKPAARDFERFENVIGDGRGEHYEIRVRMENDGSVTYRESE